MLKGVSQMPKTKLGKWSVGLGVALIALMFVGPTLDATLYKGVTAGNNILEDLSNRPLLAIPMLLAMLSGIMAFVTGLIALIKYKERAVLVYLSTGLGALLPLFLIGDTFSPE